LQKWRYAVLKKYIFLSIIIYLQGLNVFSQVKISGYVTDRNDNMPLNAVSVIIKGSTSGALTDSTGYFHLLAKKGSKIVFSFVGYESKEVYVGNDTVIHISLINSFSSLNQVVTTGYMSQVVKEITGSVTVVKGNDLTTEPVGQVDQMLQGQVSGLTVISTGEPGSTSIVRINGIGNFGDVTPLYIIDGIQGDINTLNPYDIETLQVLKDAGAYSIYGVRGANGVIVITTKKGKTGKSVLSFDAYTGYQVPLSKGLDLLNPQGQANILWQALINSNEVDPVTGLPSYPLYGNYGNSTTPVLPDYYVNGYGYRAGDPAVDPSLYNIKSGSEIYQIIPFNKSGTDWFHELFKPAWNQNYTVSASGGNEKNHYFFSLGYLNQQGTYLNTYLKKLTARVNTDFNIDNVFHLGENLQLIQSQTPYSSPNIYNGIATDPWLPVYDIEGNYSSENGPNATPADNAVAAQELAKDNVNNSWQVLGNAFGELDFLKHFNLRSSYGGTFNFNNAYGYTYGPYDTTVGLNQFTELTGYAWSWTWTNTLTFSDIFAGKHHLKVLIGTEDIGTYSRSQSGTSMGYFSDNPNLRFLGNGNGNSADQFVSSTATSTFLSSFISALNYGFDEKYFISATLREDASSVFGPESRYGWFPSFSGAWRISQEKFMYSSKWVSELKLRGSWGISGYNGNTNPLNQYSLYGGLPGGNFYDINGTSSSIVPGLSLVQIGNSKTGWQQDIMTDVGFESVLWNGLLSVTLDWYDKKSTGLLFQVALPGIFGYATAPNVNIGDVQNKGFNLTLGTKGNFSKNSSWNANIALTTYHSEVVKLNGVSYFDNPGTNSQYGPAVRDEIGYPIGSFFGYKITGLFQNAGDVAKSPVQEAASPGRFKYLDANKDGVIDPSDRVHIGNPNPLFTTGINIGLTFSRFDFSTFLYWSYGNDIFNIVKLSLDIFPGLYYSPKSVAALYGAWTPANPNAKIPIIENDQNFSNDGVTNSYGIEKGSYLRNKTMILGYTLPAGSLQKLKIQRFRVYGEVLNLFTITSYPGLDPQISGSSSAFGLDFGSYPSNQRQYLIGINLNF
jgi:TonB-dependent starch-binding outer membrane protein SusC